MHTQFNMSDQNLPNGLPPNFSNKNSAVPLNGVDSSHSSPAHRINQIPASQLPPSRSSVLTNQESTKQVTQNYANLSISQVTPHSSPKGHNFTTSTPNAHSNSESLDQFNSNKVSGLANISKESNKAKSIEQATPSINHRTFNDVPLGATSNRSVRNNNLPYSTNNFDSTAQKGSKDNSHLGLINLIGQEFEHQSLEQQKRAFENARSAEQRKLADAVHQRVPEADSFRSKEVLEIKSAPESNDLTLRGGINFMQSQPGLLSSGKQQQQQLQLQSNLKTENRGIHGQRVLTQNVPLGAHFQQPPSVQDVPAPYQGQQSAAIDQKQQGFNQNTQQQNFSVPAKPQQFGVGPQQNFYSGDSTESQQKFLSSHKSNLPQVNLQQAPVLSQKVPPNLETYSNKPQQYGFPQNFQTHQQQQNAFPPKAPPQLLANALPPNPKGIVEQQPTVSQNLPLRPLYNFQQNVQPPVSTPNVTTATREGAFNQPISSQYPNQYNGAQQVLPRSPYQQPTQNLQQQAPGLQQQPPPLANSQSQSYKTNLHANRYPPGQQVPNNPQFTTAPPSVPQQQQIQQTDPYSYYNKPNVVQSGFTKLWGQENLDILEHANILPPTKLEPPRISLGQELLDAANCSPDIFRCTMTKIPETNTLLQKSRLPLGVLIHPFKDLDHLPVIQCTNIVRCRACRTYINPFVFFIDMKRWKCNLCYRVNELPEEFQFDPVSKTYGDPTRRPEIKSSTIEYIAPSEYMLRPPQPAVYLFLLDVSHAAIESGYLQVFCNVLIDNLSSMPGDGRTQIGFIAFNSAIHFYSFADGLNRPHEMTILDVEDVFLPCPDNLLVNLNERKEMILDLLNELPTRFNNSYDTGSALGAALQIAHKLISSTGGRVTVFQSALPNCGPGYLTAREDPNQRSGNEIHHLNPANDFYKRLALECSGQQIAVDLFVVNSQYVDLATISGISKFSGGCIHHFPLFKASRTVQAESLERSLKRYLTRKIGFEAVMRIRCTRGLSIHTFHGNFFVRSTDLLSLPNINPEAGFGMQVAIDESLSDLHTVCFQAALLYTSSKGERRIRVHTLCLPIASNLPDVLAAADQQCIIGLLAKMAVDRSTQSSLVDSREAFINVAIDILSSYKLSLNLGNSSNGLVVSHRLKLLPLYISALLKHVAFRTGISTRLDDRVKAMSDMKTLPLYLLIQQIYPDLYPVHNLEDQNTTLNVDGDPIPQPPRLQLSARCLDSKGAFLMDTGEQMMILVGPNVPASFLNDVLGVADYNSISEQMYDLPILNTPQNLRLNNFINYLNDEKPFPASLHIIRENSQHRNVFLERLIEDRIETALSYHEFLQHLKTQVK